MRPDYSKVKKDAMLNCHVGTQYTSTTQCEIGLYTGEMKMGNFKVTLDRIEENIAALLDTRIITHLLINTCAYIGL